MHPLLSFLKQGLPPNIYLSREEFNDGGVPQELLLLFVITFNSDTYL